MEKLIQILFLLFGFLPYVATWPYQPYVTWMAESFAIMLTTLICAATFYFTRNEKQISLNPFSITALLLIVLTIFNTLYLRLEYLTFPILAGIYLLMIVLLTIAIQRLRNVNIDVTVSYARGIFTAGWAQIIFVFGQVTDGVAWYNSLVNDKTLMIPRYPITSATGMFFQYNQLVDFMFIAMLAGAFLFHQKKISKLHFGTWVILAGIISALTGSRSVIMFAICILGLSSYVLIWKRSEATKLYAKLIGFAALTFVGVQLITKPIAEGIAKKQTVTGLTRLADKSFFGERIRFWENGWEIFKDHPVIGTGWGQYGTESVFLQAKLGADANYNTDQFHSNAHNLFLNLLSEIGLIGTLIFAIGLAVTLYHILKKPLTSLHIMVLGVIGILMAHSMVEYPLWYAYFAIPMGAFIAIQDENWWTLKVKPALFTSVSLLFCALMVIGIVVTTHWESTLVNVTYAPMGRPLDPTDRERLIKIAQKPLLNNMADLLILGVLFDETDHYLENKLYLTEKLMKIRPNTFVLFRRALYLAYAGRTDEAIALVELATLNSRESVREMAGHFTRINPDQRLLKLYERIAQLRMLN
jgi:hypothetical protein